MKTRRIQGIHVTWPVSSSERENPGNENGKSWAESKTKSEGFIKVGTKKQGGIHNARTGRLIRSKWTGKVEGSLGLGMVGTGGTETHEEVGMQVITIHIMHQGGG